MEFDFFSLRIEAGWIYNIFIPVSTSLQLVYRARLVIIPLAERKSLLVSLSLQQGYIEAVGDLFIRAPF